MKLRSPMYFRVLAATALAFLLVASPAHARDETVHWTSVQSKNFTLVGNASEREMRKFAARLELFREAFMRLLSVEHFDSSVPMTVMVFRDDESYKPFEPLYRGQPAGVAGFFQANQDVDYLTFSIDRQHVREPDTLAFHEYVHVLVRNSFHNAPLWLNEGLAEYYSTFELSDGNRHVTLGKTINGRVQTLRTQELAPLEMLFQTDGDSDFYNEPHRRSLFYAESWALVHYLLSGQRRAQLATYLDLLAKCTPVKDAFKQAFQTDFAGMESELRQYIQLNKYRQQEITFDKRLEFDPSIRSSALTEAEAQFYLGDLLLHTNRLDAAETYLQKSIALNSNLAEAQAALGVLRVKQNRFDEAKRYLESASAKSESFLIHYYYAYVLSREPLGSDTQTDVYYAPENARRMRAELKQSIARAPHFAEGYRLLAFINLVTDESLDEAVTLLKKAIELSPRRQDFALLLAQVYSRLHEFEKTRVVLSEVMQKSSDPQTYARAQDLQRSIAAQEQFVARVKVLEAEAKKEEMPPPGVVQPCDAPQPGPQLKRLRFEGVQVCGQLVKIECASEGVTLFVETGTRTLKLHSDKLNQIRFVTYTAEVHGQVTCGLREPANPVLVTYHSAKETNGQFDGEVVAVEFVPQDWSANH